MKVVTEAMKRSIFLLIFITVFILLAGCGNKPLTDSEANGRTFIKEGDTMSDGVLTYVRLPDNWSYEGRFPYLIGTVKDGNPLESSDKEGTVVRERRESWGSMEYAPWIQTGFELPDLPPDDSDVVLTLWTGKRFSMDEQMRREFLDWFYAYSQEEDKADQPQMNTNGMRYANISFTTDRFPGFRYDCSYILVIDDGCDYIVDLHRNSRIIGTFSFDTDLYKGLKTLMTAK